MSDINQLENNCQRTPSSPKRMLGIYQIYFVLGLCAMNFDALAAEMNDQDNVGRGARVLHLASEHQITLGAGLTIVGQGMSGDNDDAGLTYSVDIALNGNFNELGKAFVYINTAQGQGIDTQAATDSNGDNESGTLYVDGEGFSETRIAEAWYQIPILDPVVLTIGKIDPTGIYDGNMAANDETAQFLADAFINNPAIAFPGYTAGVNLGLVLNQNMTLNFGAFEASSDFDGGLDSSFVIAELDHSTNLVERPVNLRFMAWNEDVNDNNGLAFNTDVRFDSNIVAFLRLGVQDDAQPFDAALSFGGQWQLQHRVIGIAYSQLTATGANAGDELQLEAYYRYLFSDHIHVTVDVQFINNPGFNSSADNVVVYGVRGQIDL